MADTPIIFSVETRRDLAIITTLSILFNPVRFVAGTNLSYDTKTFVIRSTFVFFSSEGSYRCFCYSAPCTEPFFSYRQASHTRIPHSLISFSLSLVPCLGARAQT